MVADTVFIESLDEGYVVTICEDGETDGRRIAASTRQEALTISARAFGYRGVIRFDDEPRTVEVPIKGVTRAEFEVAATQAGFSPGMYDLPEGPILTQAYGLGPGPAVDDEEPPLRAGTATKPDDLL